MAEESFRLLSPAMQPRDSRMPRKYTGDGQGAVKDISPPLEWYGVPPGTKSLALIVEDISEPDNPLGPSIPWTHWVVVNIPAELKGLPEGFSGKEEELGKEFTALKEGHNDWKVRGWRGPKASPGHKIRFRLLALEEEMELGNKITKERVLEAFDQDREMDPLHFVRNDEDPNLVV